MVLLRPELSDAAMKTLCSPASLVLAVGTSVVVSGLTGAPEPAGKASVVPLWACSRPSVSKWDGIVNTLLSHSFACR